VAGVHVFTGLRLAEQEPLDQNLSDGYDARLKSAFCRGRRWDRGPNAEIE